MNIAKYRTNPYGLFQLIYKIKYSCFTCLDTDVGLSEIKNKREKVIEESDMELQTKRKEKT